MLARVLEDAGYQVSEATTGREGLEQFRAQPVDLVITDLEMPEMTGLESLGLGISLVYPYLAFSSKCGYGSGEKSTCCRER